jgi:aminoglycoside phosphotransferase (APT) family kinase protein
LENYVAPEIPSYAKSIIKATLGTKAELHSVEWTAGGLYNKVFYIHTSEGCFILKIECKKIFPSTRTGQTENEVEGMRLFRKAGIPCPSVLSYDFTGNEIGVRYVFTERVSGDIVMVEQHGMSDEVKNEVSRQGGEICEKMKTITNTHFGSLTPSGPLGWHQTWTDCYRAWFNLLIDDGANTGLFTDDELSILRTAANKPLEYSKTYPPTFETGDFGLHNMIWGHINGEPDALHVIDFGNSRFILPHLTEWGLWGYNPNDVPNARELDKGLNLLLLYDFEMGVMWKEMAKMTEDYTHCLDGMTGYIEQSKKDSSRSHIIDFVEKCRIVIEG